MRSRSLSDRNSVITQDKGLREGSNETPTVLLCYTSDRSRLPSDSGQALTSRVQEPGVGKREPRYVVTLTPTARQVSPRPGSETSRTLTTVPGRRRASARRIAGVAYSTT